MRGWWLVAGAALLLGCSHRRAAPATETAAAESETPPGYSGESSARPLPKGPAGEWVAKARSELAQGRYLEALAALRQALKAEPKLSGEEPGEAASRLEGLLGDLGIPARPIRLKDLATADGGEAASAARSAIEAFVEREDLKALLLASAALGVDPGRETFRALLESLSARTRIPIAADEVVPRAALIQMKLKRAETAFFEDRFGEAAQACQQALWLDPRNAVAWERLGSARYAVGEKDKARQAYTKAISLDPANESLRKFMEDRGWLQ